MSVQRRTACLIFDVTIGVDPDWALGPLPVRAAPLEAQTSLLSSSADGVERLKYFEERVGEALYGSSLEPVRWHLMTTNRLGACSVFGLELLRLPRALGAIEEGIAVIHLELRESPVEALAEVANLSAPDTGSDSNRLEVARLFPQGVELAPGQNRAHTIAHVTFSDSPSPIMGENYAKWRASDQWLWLLASATPVNNFPPDPDDEDLFRGRVWFSRDWQCLVLRNGAAFVGLTPDDGGSRTFHAFAETYVHSIYLDVFILGWMQRAALNRMANEIARLRPHRTVARVLAELEFRLADMRLILWSSHVTLQGRGNELLARFQEQNRLPELFSSIVADLEHSGRLVQAMTSRRLNDALGLLTVFGLPFGIAFAAGQLWKDGGVGLVGVWTLAAVVVAVILFVAIPPVREMLQSVLRRPSERD